MGGARNVGTKMETFLKFLQVEKLRTEEPDVRLRDALKRFKLGVMTYYRLKEKYDAKKTA